MRLINALKRFGLVFVGIAFIVAYIFGLGCAQIASASTSLSYAADCNFNAYGRTACNGYLTNNNLYLTSDGGVPENDVLVDPTDPSANAIPASVDSASTFISFYENYLNRGSPTSYDFDSLGAAITIEIMLGTNGSDVCKWYDGNSACNWQAAIAYAQDPTHLADWEARVNYYDSQGWITWNDTMYENLGTPDSGHACTTSTLQCWQAGYPYPPNSPSADARDIAWSGNEWPGTQHVIEFNNPDGSQFILDRLCSNEIGDTDGIGATPPPPPPTCASVTANPATLDPDRSFTISAAVDFVNSSDATSALSAGDKIKIAVSGPNTYNSGSLRPSQSGTELSAKTGSIGPIGTGSYTINANLYDASGNALVSGGCSSSFRITDMPYFSTTSGDVSAGASMDVGGTDCATPADPKAGIVSWNQENATYDGAGTQYAAIALNYLQDFATAQGTSGEVPTGLSFSNTQNVSLGGTGSDTYGGAFGSESCMTDYYDNHPANPTYTGNQTFNPSDIGKTIFIQSGNLTINAPLSIANGTHTTIYVDGNVQITGGNITFSNSYASVNAIPSFTIVASGNIFIDKSVGQLDGWYIAEPDSSGNNGIIYTCAVGASAPALDDTLYNNCNAQLKVNGSLVGRQIWLTRTFGTLYGNSASESVSFNPEIWLSEPPPISSGSAGASNGYDALTELPPTL